MLVTTPGGRAEHLMTDHRRHRRNRQVTSKNHWSEHDLAFDISSMGTGIGNWIWNRHAITRALTSREERSVSRTQTETEGFGVGRQSGWAIGHWAFTV